MPGNEICKNKIPMLSPENLSLFILTGIFSFFIALIFLPVEIVVEEEIPGDEL